jgi:hypothetical protein
MVFADQVFYIHGPPTHLPSVHVTNQRLLADRIFLAHHAASLRQTSFFARWKLQRVSSQLQNPLVRFPRLSSKWILSECAMTREQIAKVQ